MSAPKTIPLRTCTLDLDALTVVRADGTETALTPTEGKVLRYLVENHGRAVPREELLEQAWGYRSGVRSRTVDTTMGRLRNKLEVDPSEPDHLLTVFGVGYRLEVPALEAPGLFGRAADLRRLRAAADVHRMVLVVGTAGVGKTTLVRTWAEAQQDRPPVVPLSGRTDAAGLAAAVAEALDLTLSDPDPVEATGKALAEVDQGALVLDGLEVVEGVAAHALRRWLELAPSLRLVGTSRVALDLPGSEPLRLEPLDHEAAIALFAERAGLEDGSDPDALRRIVEGLGALPLALELAAGWTPVLGLAALVDRVATFRSTHLADSIAQSWEILDDDLREVLSACALFEGAFTADGADAAHGAATGEALVTLDRRCLLHGEGAELRLYDAVRAYVRDRAPAPDAARTRLARWLAERAAPRWLPDQALALQHVTDAPLEARLALRLVDTHLRHGLLDAALEHSERATALAGDLDPELASACWLGRARALEHASRYDEAVQAGERAHQLAPSAADRLRALLRCTRIRVAEGRTHEALECLDRAEQPEDAPALVAEMLNQRANTLRMLGRTREAEAPYERAIALLSRGEDRAGLLHPYTNLGTLQMELGRPDRSFVHFAAAREIAEAHNPRMLALVVGNVAETLRVMGRADDARPLFEEAEELARDQLNLRCILHIQQSALELEAGRIDEAAVLVARALSESGAALPRYRAFATLQQGGVHHARGWRTLARETYELAIERLEALGDARHVKLARARLAALLAGDDPDRARALVGALEAEPVGVPALDDALRVYAAVVHLRDGIDPGPVLDEMTRADPDRPDPTRAAWNPELRYALDRLREAMA